MIFVLFKEPTILTISLYDLAEYKIMGNFYMVSTLVLELNKIIKRPFNEQLF